MKSLGIDAEDLLRKVDSKFLEKLANEIDERGPGEELARAGSRKFTVPMSRTIEEAPVGGEELAGVARGEGRPGLREVTEEVIIQKLAPVFRVDGSQVQVGEVVTESDHVWKPIIKDRQATIADVLPSVGRVEARLAAGKYVALGTAWVIEGGLLVTNRHVARYFAQHGRDGLVFRDAIPGPSPMDCRIDFADQPDLTGGVRIPADGIVYLSKLNRPDIAILRLPEDQVGMFRPLRMRLDPLLDDDKVAAIGFPQRDERARPADVRRIFGDVFDCKRFAPGFVKAVEHDTIVHLCSTLGGNSGSPIIDIASGEVAGIHFGGHLDRENYAEPVATIRNILAEIASASLGRSGNRPAVAMRETSMSGNSISITVPITITVEVGQPAGASVGGMAIAQPVVPSGLAGTGLEEAVEAARRTFGDYAGVVNIRAGWKFRDGWITDEKAIVIAVTEKKAMAELQAIGRMPLPSEFGGYPVDVKPTSPFDIIPQLRDAVLTEASIRSGTYERDAAEFPLDFAERKMKGEIHLGPDAGSEMLTDFIELTEDDLTIGMYMLTAPHVIEALKKAVEPDGRKLTLVLDPNESLGKEGSVKQDDEEEVNTVAELEAMLGDRFVHQTALVGQRRVWPWAYHVKVAVRDRKATWLSSGSWQSSNQPDSKRRTPDSSGDEPDLLKSHNREWHVVLEDEGIASQLANHVVQDEVDCRTVEETAMGAEDIIYVDYLEESLTVEETTVPTRYFEPLKFNRSIAVQPILTPDNYPEKVLELIRSAKHTILFQNQSLSIAQNRDDRFNELLDALKEKQAELDDVRIILRGEFARDQIERMKDYGFDVSADKVRLQDRCHAKTMIVDGRRVLIGSHNFTDSGTTANRDASFLFDDEEIARYATEVFDYDWGRTRAAIREPVRGARLYGEETVGAAGMTPIPISDLGLL